MLTDIKYAIKQLRGINCQQSYMSNADKRDRALDALERVEEALQARQDEELARENLFEDAIHGNRNNN